MKDKTFTRYLSNVKDEGFKTLQLSNLAHPTTKTDHFPPIDRLLTAAQSDLPPEQFQEAFKKLVQKYCPDMDLTAVIGDMHLGSTRHASPKRKLCGEMKTPRTTLLRRTVVLDKEDIQTNLVYTYEPMDETDRS